MPTGENPNSRANLNKGKKTRFSGERAVKAAKKSVEVRRESRKLCDILRECLTDEKRKQISLMLIEKAEDGDTKAFELIRDSIGEKPTDKVEQINANIDIDLGDLDDTD